MSCFNESIPMCRCLSRNACVTFASLLAVFTPSGVIGWSDTSSSAPVVISLWKHDDQFKKYLKKIRVLAIDMETATIFMTGFYNEIPTGALLLVSDQPMTPEGVKTAASDKLVDHDFVTSHLRIGMDALKQLINKGLTVKHLRF